MKTEKFIVVALIVSIISILAGTSYAAERKIGALSRLNVTPEQMQDRVAAKHSRGELDLFMSGKTYDKTLPVFYDSLISMQMALNAGEIDAISLPEAVANYFMNTNEGYESVGISRGPPYSLVLGFRQDDDTALRDSFNEALKSIKADGTLAILKEKYIDDAGINPPEPVKFEKYSDSSTTIKAAVTGDFPPIDYIGADGEPAGFNTAILAEIAKRMKVNIELVNIESGARAAALASKRADVVFWFEYHHGANMQVDIPEGIVLSEPYYSWNENIEIAKK